jgi:unsaturated chondroitin disaccharide hydrolase
LTFEPIWEQTVLKVKKMIDQIGVRSPHAAVEGIYDDMRLDWWTSGFWPGMLWIMYDMTGDEIFRNAAWSWDERIERQMIMDSNFHHDVGFQFLPTAVIKYAITKDLQARRRGLQAANFLAGRFNPAGRFLRAWNQDKTGWAIVDSSMNLSLLFWAAEEIKDPRFKHIACAHADTILRYFIREDGSVNHIVSFDPETGEYIESLGGQGYAPQSAWSRGQAWALHGMANTYRFTGEIRYLNAAKQVAHFFLASLPEDHIPLWDFRVPNPVGEPKDTSAASCAASGLLEIAKQVPAEEAALYQSAAENILFSLTERYASSWDNHTFQPILREGTGHKPANQNVNVGLIYGDYFYVEALAKWKGWTRNIF